MEVGSYEKNIFSGLQLKNLVFTDVEVLPKPNLIRVQEVTVNVSGPSLKDLVVIVDHARLQLPDSSPIVVTGSLRDGLLDINAYTNSLTNFHFEELTGNTQLSHVYIDAENVDIFVKGSLDAPRITGKFFVQELDYEHFIAKGQQGKVDLSLKGFNASNGLTGQVILSGGSVQGRRTAIIAMEGVRLSFSGEMANPYLYISGKTKVEKIPMQIKITGPLKEPDIFIQSDPQLSQQTLLLMIATNRSWGAASDSLTAGKVTTDMIKDFIGYFFFPHTQNKVLERFGVELTFEEGRRGLSIEKGVLDKATIGYGVEQRFEGDAATEAWHKIGVGYDVTDKVSVEAQREYIQETPSAKAEAASSTGAERPPEDTVFLKYKKKF